MGEGSADDGDRFEARPTTLLVVAGAHLRGEPLHPSLLALGARFVRATRTAPEYRMVALPALDEEGGRPAVPPRPGLVRDPPRGEALEVEIYELPVSALGRLLLTVAPPLAIGTVALADGAAAPGSSARDMPRVGARHLRLRRVARIPAAAHPRSSQRVMNLMV